MDTPAPTAVPVGDDRCPQCDHEVGGAWLVCAWCGHQLAAAAELASGSRLADGRYQVLRVIGRGGFGITYDVGDRRLQRRVAMKELFPESAVRHGSMVLTPPQGRAEFRAARDRFLREARVLARFTHPGIVRVYEVFEEHGTAYLVMELLEGRTLVELLQQRNRPFPEAEVLDVAGRVAAALRPVHAAGVLHRDVNPSNVMMTHHGRIVVIDFGLARDYDQTETQGMTRVVTPGYAPLEQYRGAGHFGPSTDVYGLAATCYRLATGKVPISAIERDGGRQLPSPRSINPMISKAVSDAILDGLELEPSHRPQDLDAYLSRLGITRLPDGPRSMLLDTVPPPTPAPPMAEVPAAVGVAAAPPAPAAAAAAAESVTGATEVVGRTPSPPGSPAAEPVSGATEVVGRRTAGAVRPMGGPTPAFAATGLAAGFGGRSAPDATRPDPGLGRDRPGAPAGPDATRRVGGGTDRFDDPTVGPAPDHVRTTIARPTGPPPPPPPPAGLSRMPHEVAPDPRLPLAVGPNRPGRRKLLVPLMAVALAAGSAAPVLVTAVVVLVVLPALATWGDSVAHRLRSDAGIAGGWLERRAAPAALAPARFVRNVVVSVLRSTVMVVVGGVLVAAWYGLDRLTDTALVLDLSLRVIGVLVVGVILALGRHGSARFRSALGIDELVAAFVPRGRTNERLVILWVVCTFVIAGSIWLTPSAFPLP